MNPVPQHQTTGENPGSEHRRATGELLKTQKQMLGPCPSLLGLTFLLAQTPQR